MLETPRCGLCAGDAQAHAGALGPLRGPCGRSSDTSEPVFIHRLCALWSPEVYQTETGTLRNVTAAVKRGRSIRCAHCNQRGASVGCRLERCPNSYHLLCAKHAGCVFFPAKYLVACPQHASQFRHEPEQNRAFPQSPYRPPRARQHHYGIGAPLLPAATVAPLPATASRKRNRSGADAAEHVAVARSALKRARICARAKQAVSSDDEEHFLKKERRRLARDRAQLAPLTLGGQPAAAPGGATGPGRGQAGTDVAAEGWAAVGGLAPLVAQLKEMVLLPLVYPDLFRQLGTGPPRGILLHGPPGCGKTLVARALAGACAQQSPHPVTFFARKGADCLGKFAGEAERTLRLLFEQASQRAPSIIFLDELDGLVPARSARAGGSDQIYASVVSTMLALMDGVTDRGAVVVLAATNRPDAIDPALRRPGRFDREVRLGLPTAADRTAILRVHTRRWEAPPSQAVLEAVAAATPGWAGADLAALATGAVLAAAARRAPRLLDQLDRHLPAPQSSALPPATRPPGSPSSQPPTPAAVSSAPTTAGAQASELGGAVARGGPAHSPEQRSPHEPPQAAPAPAPAQAQLPRCPIEPEHVFRDLKVKLCDWRTALARAPAPCARRAGLAALAADQAHPVPYHLAPPLLPALAQALQGLHAAGVPLPAPAAWAVAAAVAGEGAAELPAQLEEALLAVGCLHPPPGWVGSAEAQSVPDAPAGEAGEEPGHIPCRMLLCGEAADSGQQHVAGGLLQLLSSAAVEVVSLAALATQGGGDPQLGITRCVSAALARASPGSPAVLYLPRLEAWAISRAPVAPEDIAEMLRASAGASRVQATPAGPAAPGLAAAATPGVTPHARGGPTPSGRLEGSVGHALHPSDAPFRGLVSLEERMRHTPATCHRPATAATMSATGGESGCAARHAIPALAGHAPGAPGERRQEGPAGDLVEAVTLSDTWKVFDQLIRQVPPSQPLVLVGTCHGGRLKELLSFWGSHQPAAATAGDALPGRQAGAQRVIMLPRVACPEAWRQVLRRAAGNAAQAAAAACLAALQLHAQPGGQRAPVATAPAAEPGQPSCTSPPLLACNGVPEQRRRQPAAAELNEAELEQASRLQGQVQAVIMQCGVRLLRDPRTRLAQGSAWPAGSPGVLGHGVRQPPSMPAMAQQAMAGGFHTLDHFQAAVATVALALRQLAGPRTQEAHSIRYSAAAAAGSALEDEVAAACRAARAALGLALPANQRLLAALAARRAGSPAASHAPSRSQLPAVALLSPHAAQANRDPDSGTLLAGPPAGVAVQPAARLPGAGGVAAPADQAVAPSCPPTGCQAQAEAGSGGGDGACLPQAEAQLESSQSQPQAGAGPRTSWALHPHMSPPARDTCCHLGKLRPACTALLQDACLASFEAAAGHWRGQGGRSWLEVVGQLGAVAMRAALAAAQHHSGHSGAHQRPACPPGLPPAGSTRAELPHAHCCMADEVATAMSCAVAGAALL